jgi:hypothetical protein
MVDYRFSSPGVDKRFPGSGVDVESPSPGVDGRFTAPGVDERFQGPYGAVAPTITTPPSISGATVQGSTLTCTPGVWAGSPAPTITREWLRAGVAISGATGLTYVTQAGDVGQAITCRETATNSGGSANSTSNAITVTSSFSLPANTVAPVISGAAEEGSVLTVADGTWTGNPAPSFTHQWQADGVGIAGQTATTYTTVTDDVGKAITCRVTATNSQGSVNATSNAITVTPLPLSAEFNTWVATQPNEHRPYYIFVALYCRRNNIRVVNGIGTPSFDDALDAAALRYPESEHLNQQPRSFWRAFLRRVWS